MSLLYQFFKLLMSLFSDKQASAQDKTAPVELERSEPEAEAVSESNEPAISYRRKDSITTPTEFIAFRQLSSALRGVAIVCPKVRIADILEVNPTGSRKIDGPAFLRISQKHVDFLIVDRSGRILAALEVDDRSHERKSRQKRDEFVNAAFASAGLPLFRTKPGKLNESEPLRRFVAELRRCHETEIAA